MNDFLTKDKSHLRLFQDNIVIDKRLPKWRRAEAGIKKTGSSEFNSAYVTNVENPTPTFLINTTPGMDHTVGTPMVGSGDNFDPDADINAQTRWLPLYETPEGVSFDELATAGIQDLTRLIVEKKIKYVMAGYGAFGSTVGTLTYVNGDSESAQIKLTLEEIKNKMNQEPWYKRIWNTITKKNMVDETNTTKIVKSIFLFNLS